MGIKKIEIDNLSSFIDFEFDISGKENTNKYVAIFGTNGSGKSSLVNMLETLNRYHVDLNEEVLKDFLKKKISKESSSNQIQVKIEFDDGSYDMTFNDVTNQMKIDGEWKKLKVLNENYTNAAIGTTIEINLQENGLIIGEPNKQLDSERTKQKKLDEQKVKYEKKIDEIISKAKKNYKEQTGSSANKNLEKISEENLLASTCSYEKDDTLLQQREALGKSKQEQQSSIIDIKKINSFFDIERWEKLFNEKVTQPILTEEYKSLLIKYSDFYKDGMGIAEEDDLEEKCPYCLQQWGEKNQVLNEFQEYLTSEYNVKKEKIETLKKEIKNFENILVGINKDIMLQEKIVKNECAKYSVDSTPYKTVAFDESLVQKIIKLIDGKTAKMEEFSSVKVLLENLQNHHVALFEQSNKPLQEIKKIIDGRQSLVIKLNTEIAEHMMKCLWEDNQNLRDDFNKIGKLFDECNAKIEELEAKNEDIHTIQEVFNGLLKFIGLEEYYLDSDNKLQLKIDSSYDISNEGTRISSAQRKILSLCYFYAELISEVSHEKELKNYTIIYDDPVDSADYIFFHSITSLIENIERVLSKILQKPSVNIGQHIVFTHNSLLFNRLTQNFDFYKKIKKVDKKTQAFKADKIENNYKIYIEMIVDFYKKDEDETENKDKIFIGNIIRRVLEIIISFNELNSNNVSIVKDYGKPTLGMIANHLSHENFSKVLNPLPTDDEMKIACEELFELIRENHPRQYEYIQKSLLD